VTRFTSLLLPEANHRDIQNFDDQPLDNQSLASPGICALVRNIIILVKDGRPPTHSHLLKERMRRVNQERDAEIRIDSKRNILPEITINLSNH
jgi:hypothetical protein